MINQELLTSEEKLNLKNLELAELLELTPFPSIQISQKEKLSYIQFMLSDISVKRKLFQKCGGGDVQVAMARSLVRIKNKKG